MFSSVAKRVSRVFVAQGILRRLSEAGEVSTSRPPMLEVAPWSPLARDNSPASEVTTRHDVPTYATNSSTLAVRVTPFYC